MQMQEAESRLETMDERSSRMALMSAGAVPRGSSSQPGETEAKEGRSSNVGVVMKVMLECREVEQAGEERAGERGRHFDVECVDADLLCDRRW